MKSLNLNRIDVFLAIYKQGSMRAAAKYLQIKPPAISQQLTALEQDLGVKLFIRTTRSLRLTEHGKLFLQQVKPALEQVQTAVESTRQLTTTTTGKLKITLPYRAYQIVIEPKLLDFYEQNPGVRLELSFNESFVDIVNEDFHAGIRLGEHVSQDMVATQLMPATREVYVASPDYCQRMGIPETPEDLFEHQCIVYRQIESNQIMPWRFYGKDGIYELKPPGYLVFDNMRAITDAAKIGMGIGFSLSGGVDNELANGELVSVLPNFAIHRPGFYLYYPHSNRQYNVLKLFRDFFKYQ